MLHCSRIQLAHLLQSIDWLGIGQYYFPNTCSLRSWLWHDVNSSSSTSNAFTDTDPWFSNQSSYPTSKFPWNLKSPSWMLRHLLEHAKRKGLRVSKSTSLTPTPPPGDPPKNLILWWTFLLSLWSIMTMLMSSENPRPTPYLLIGLMTSRSTLRREHLHLLVWSIPSLQQNLLHSVNSLMSTSSPVLSVLQTLLTELPSFPSRRKMDNSGYILTSVVSTESWRKTTTHFCLSLTCWMLPGKPVCIPKLISGMLTTSSASLKWWTKNCLPDPLQILWVVYNAFWTYQCTCCFPTFYEWDFCWPLRCLHHDLPRWHSHLLQ